MPTLCLSFHLPTGTHQGLTMAKSFSNVMNCEMLKIGRLIILMHRAISACHTVFLGPSVGKLTLDLNMHLVH